MWFFGIVGFSVILQSIKLWFQGQPGQQGYPGESGPKGSQGSPGSRGDIGLPGEGGKRVCTFSQSFFLEIVKI